MLLIVSFVKNVPSWKNIVCIVNIQVMNTMQQYQYLEMMRQSRNSALYRIFSMQGLAAGDSGNEPAPEPPTDLSTFIEFDDGTSEWFDFSGEITQQTMADAGLYDPENYEWIRNPVNVTIGRNVTSIGYWAFITCRSLTSVTIPNSVTSIGDGTFSGCISLTSVTIPDSVTSIGDWAFNGCSGLTSATIPDSVTTIGERAFSGCTIQLEMNGKSIEQVNDMNDGQWWDLQPGSTIICTDGTIEI